MKTLAILMLAAGVLQMNGFGQAPPAPPPPPHPELLDSENARREAVIHAKWNVCVDVQMVVMEEEKALDLIPQFQSPEPAEVDAAWTKLQAMIKAHEATLLAWPMVRTVDGARAVSESITEKPYPTEFASPLVGKTGAPVSPPQAATADKPAVEDAIPTGFETRNLGPTLEVEATVLDEGKRVHLMIVPQRVELLGTEQFGSSVGNGKLVVQEPQPVFGSSKTTEDLTLLSGQRQLLGVHKLSKPENNIELHIAHVVVTKAE